MPKFIRNGPDIPERLLQAHEDGRVVFFCGAGISYPARLPGFAGLVERLYKALGTTPNAVQKAAIKAGLDRKIGVTTGLFTPFVAAQDSAPFMVREQAGIANSGRRRWQSRP